MNGLDSFRSGPAHLLAMFMSLACTAGTPASAEDLPRIPSPTTVIWSASGARSGTQLTTMAVCSNHGSVAGTIGARFYEFDGVQKCTIAHAGVPPGETRTLMVDPVASMAGGQICAGAPILQQGRIELYVNANETSKFDCTVMLVDKTDNPPVNMTRLTLFSGSGVVRSDLIFADGIDP